MHGDTTPDGHAGHDHHHRAVSGSRLAGAAALNTGFAVIQVVVGLAIGSVVVLADAAHQVVDAIGLLTALAAVVLATRPSSPSMSFGWGKFDALGGLLSGLLLLGSVAWISTESIRRLADPVDVEGGGVIVIGLIAVAVNGLSILALGHGSSDLLSLRAARLHLLTDLAGSFLVVLAGLVLAGTNITWIDPAASLVLCVVVLRATVLLLRNAAAELLDRAPSGITADSVSRSLTEQPGVHDVHHVHVRSLGQQRTSVTAHVVIDGEQSLHDAQAQIASLTAVLERDLDVQHATLQLECHPCPEPDC